MSSLPPSTTLARGLPFPRRAGWSLRRIGDLVRLNYGKALKAQDRVEGNVPVFGTNGQCGWHDTALATGPGVILGRKGQGPLGVEWSKVDYWVIDTAYFAEVDEAQLDLRFFYDVTSYVGLNHLKDGTSNPGLSRDRFYSQAFPIPPLPTQRRIASILSAYDDLIENNTKRIEILEEMARSLYREWFVHFRFPGHEKVKLVDSELGKIPEGWEVASLHEVTTKIGSGATPRGGKSGYKDSGMSLIRSLNIYDYRFADEGLAFIDEEQAMKLSNVSVEKEDILLNITGASVGRCAMVPERILPARVNQHVSILRADRRRLNAYYLLLAINYQGNKQQLMNVAQGGATREAITKGHLEKFKIVLPDRDLMKRSGDYLQAFMQQRENLAHKNHVLRQTRDLLLPKLISGEIDVDALDLPEELPRSGARRRKGRGKIDADALALQETG